MPVKKPELTLVEPKTERPYMPGYGLPKGRKGLLPWEWAKERLENSRQNANLFLREPLVSKLPQPG